MRLARPAVLAACAASLSFGACRRKTEPPFAPSEANFIWVDVKRDSREVFNRLLRKGIIVRTGDVFDSPTHLRITIGTDEELDLLLDALGSAISS